MNYYNNKRNRDYTDIEERKEEKQSATHSELQNQAKVFIEEINKEPLETQGALLLEHTICPLNIDQKDKIRSEAAHNGMVCDERVATYKSWAKITGAEKARYQNKRQNYLLLEESRKAFHAKQKSVFKIVLTSCYYAALQDLILAEQRIGILQEAKTRSLKLMQKYIPNID